MAAKIDISEQGIKGGNFHRKESGYVNIKIDENESNRITLDAFSGSGINYKRLNESIINIFNNNEPVFSGTFNELVEKLYKK